MLGSRHPTLLCAPPPPCACTGFQSVVQEGRVGRDIFGLHCVASRLGSSIRNECGALTLTVGSVEQLALMHVLHAVKQKRKGMGAEVLQCAEQTSHVQSTLCQLSMNLD